MNEPAGPDWVPPGVDINVPSIARVYDYYLGGSHNFAADRDAARKALGAFPAGVRAVHEMRSFLRRAVLFLVEQGVTQFLDIGSGIPTVGNVHEIAQAANRDARVVYVDIDPVAVAHSRALLRGNDQTVTIQADIRQWRHILDHPDTRRVLDLNQPIALLMLAVLHFIPDADDPAGLVQRYGDALAPGSYLAITHGTMDHAGSEKFTGFKAIYDRAVARTITRTKAEVEMLFTGFEFVEPGLVRTSLWRPDPDSQPPDVPESYGGVGRKPDRPSDVVSGA